MSTTPDARPVRGTAATLAADIRTALAAPDTPLAVGAVAALALAADLVHAETDLRWARDAALELARRRGATWHELHLATGVPDSTLAQRHQRWADRERDR